MDEREFKIQFTRKALALLIVPLIIEQVLGILMGIVDTMMVSGLGDAAVSGVSLVDMLCALFINMFSALATGGAVVASRAIGAGDPAKAKRSAFGLMLISFTASLFIMLVVYAGDVRLIRLLYGELEPDVASAARTYMLVSAVSFPFIALYNGAAALFRSMGNSKIFHALFDVCERAERCGQCAVHLCSASRRIRSGSGDRGRTDCGVCISDDPARRPAASDPSGLPADSP